MIPEEFYGKGVTKHAVLWDLHRDPVFRVYVKRHSKAHQELLEGKIQEEDCVLYLTSDGEHKTCKSSCIQCYEGP